MEQPGSIVTEVLLKPYNLSTEKRPIWSNYLGLCSIFCVFISRFLLLWQQRLVQVKFRLHS